MPRQRRPELRDLLPALPAALRAPARTLWRRCRCLTRVPLLLWSITAAACTSLETDEASPGVPAADRESWGARLEVRGRNSTVIIAAPYVQDFLEGQVARADSGVAIVFLDRDGYEQTRLTAGRLTLSYDSQLVGVADSVVLRAGDSIWVRSDTLVWQPEEDILLIPGPLLIEQPQGHTEGRDLTTAPGLTGWIVQEPRTRWHGDGNSPGLWAAARRANVSRAHGQIEAVYDSFSANFEGRSLTSTAARYVGSGGGRIQLTGGVAAMDSTWFLHADTLDYDLGGRALEARGHVELGDGDLGLVAALLIETAGGAEWVASGDPARVADGDVSLEAPQVAYQRGRQLVAAWPAALKWGDRQLRADSLTYDRGRGEARSVGDVRLTSPAFAGQARSARATFAPERGTATLSGAPSLTRAADGEELVISADTLYLDLEARVLRGEPGFAVSAAPVSVRSRRGVYRAGDELAELAGDVELIQAAGQGARLTADSMVVRLTDQAIARVEVPGLLSGTVGQPATQLTWLEAAAAVIELTEGRLSTIELSGKAQATHREARHGRASRFRASDMTLKFGAGEQLQSVQARGGAQVSAVLPDQTEGASASNRVEGQVLEIALTEGEVVEVRVLESIEGRFLPAAEEVPEREN